MCKIREVMLHITTQLIFIYNEIKIIVLYQVISDRFQERLEEADGHIWLHIETSYKLSPVVVITVF